jgi:LysM repeat protein
VLWSYSVWYNRAQFFGESEQIVLVTRTQNRTHDTSRRPAVFFTFALLGIFLIGLQFSAAYGSKNLAQHGPVLQVAPPVTPQPPQPDGSIIHEVRPGDTLAGIAVAYKVDIEELRKLNNIPPEVGNIYYGQKLIIKLAPVQTLPPNATFVIVTATHTPEGANPPAAVTFVVATNASANVTPTEDSGPILITVTPVGTTGESAATTAEPSPTVIPSETPTVQPTDTELPPTATLVPITTNALLCITAFNDANTNHWRDGDEALLSDVSLTIKQGENTVKDAKSTTDTDTCFDDLQPNTYTIIAAAPSDYGLTTASQLEVDIKAGAKTNVAVGAAQGYVPPVSDTSQAVAAAATTAPATPRQSIVESALSNSGIIVLVLAAIVLVGGLAVAYIARRA